MRWSTIVGLGLLAITSSFAADPARADAEPCGPPYPACPPPPEPPRCETFIGVAGHYPACCPRPPLLALTSPDPQVVGDWLQRCHLV
ncbi:MAG TPA: hypothetical protein VM681_06090 [Candidatus Thermoplasmatota archaeon]|nr:hypothetical protein [Candidatus Thermoplasmatota archaeon]